MNGIPVATCGVTHVLGFCSLCADRAERKVDDIEYEIKSVDVVLRLLRADRKAADKMDDKLSIMKHERHIEHMRAKLRRELFAAMDERLACDCGRPADSEPGRHE